MSALRTFLPLSLAMLAAAACASSDGSSSTPNACSTGAPYTNTSPPPYRASSASSAPSSLPECTPRCGATQKYQGVGVSSYGLESLPSGACTREETCRMGAGGTQTCPGQPTQACNLSLYECACAGGTWSCVTVSQGMGLCAPCDRDAGAATP